MMASAYSYEFIQRGDIDRLAPAQFHVSHALAGALQEAGRIVQRRPVEEADIHVSGEGVSVAERSVLHARYGMPGVQEFANGRAAPAHPFKPWLDHAAQLVVRRGEPGVDAGVSPDRARKPHELAHPSRLPPWPVKSSQSLRGALTPGQSGHNVQGINGKYSRSGLMFRSSAARALALL